MRIVFVRVAVEAAGRLASGAPQPRNALFAARSVTEIGRIDDGGLIAGKRIKNLAIDRKLVRHVSSTVPAATAGALLIRAALEQHRKQALLNMKPVMRLPEDPALRPIFHVG